MRTLVVLFVFISLFSSCSQTYYIVRHAEKESPDATATMMKNDPPLSEAGKIRAEALKETLKNKKIGYIFSTNTIRTKTTAEPTRSYFNLAVETYAPIPDSAFISRLRSLKKNVLIVGHSNTVDDVVNKICRETKVPGDLPDTAYDNLYVIKRKGKKLTFENLKYGQPAL